MVEFNAQLITRFEDWFVIESEHEFSGESISDALERLATHILLEELKGAAESITSYISSELDSENFAEYQAGELSAGVFVQVTELNFSLFLPFKDNQFNLAWAEISEDHLANGRLLLHLLRIKSL